MAQKKIQKKPQICYASNLIIPILYQKTNIIINYASGSEIDPFPARLLIKDLK